MDQSKKAIQELRALQVHLKEADSLKKEIASAEERIRKGLSDEYFYCEQEPANEEQNRRSRCVSGNAERMERILKISRICLVALFVVILGTIVATVPEEEGSSWIGGFTAIGGWLCIGYWIATVIILKKIDYHSNKLSRKQRAWIAEGARMDRDTEERNRRAYAAARDASYKEQQEWIDELKRDLPEDRKKLAQHQAAIAASNVVSNKDKNLETIGSLIKQLANRRANSVQEALLQHDSKKAAAEEERKRIAHLQFLYDMQRQADGQRRVEEANAYLRQTLHNIEMQKQARRQTEELERIRKELENANR